MLAFQLTDRFLGPTHRRQLHPITRSQTSLPTPATENTHANDLQITRHKRKDVVRYISCLAELCTGLLRYNHVAYLPSNLLTKNNNEILVGPRRKDRLAMRYSHLRSHHSPFHSFACFLRLFYPQNFNLYATPLPPRIYMYNIRA